MTKQKSTKRALLSSGLALIMCVSMLIGSTFAWFTDTASTGVNTIQSGKLDVALEMYENGEWVNAEGKTLDFIKAEGAEDEEILWEPGCTYELPKLRVVNKGNLALKYSIQITGINGDAKLNEAIDWTITYPTEVGPRGLTVNGFNDGALFAGEISSEMTIKGHMKEDAGNEYQNLSIDGIAITVHASQLSAEEDSFGSEYDANAPFTSYWDGVTVGEVPELVDGERHITNAAEFAAVMAATTSGNSSSLYAGETLVLDCDIDFGGKTISGIGGHNDNVAFTFDGNNHTISNFVINGKDDAHKEPQPDGSVEYRYAGLFQQFNGTVKDLTVKKATVIGDQMVGIIASNVDAGAKIIDCKVYDSIVIGARKVGSVAGYIAGAGCTITGCYAENINIYATGQSAEIVGYTGTGAEVSDNTATNVIVGRLRTLNAGETVNIGNEANNTLILGNGATVTVPVNESLNRIWASNTTFKDVVFEGDNDLWIKGNATFIDCTFNMAINNAEPVAGTVTFEDCTFNQAVHFAPASKGADVTGKFFVAEGCTFNGMLTVQGFESVSLINCALFGDGSWSGKNMISYCPVVVDGCRFTTGIRLAFGMNASDVTCTNGQVTVAWPIGNDRTDSATVGD